MSSLLRFCTLFFVPKWFGCAPPSAQFFHPSHLYGEHWPLGSRCALRTQTLTLPWSTAQASDDRDREPRKPMLVGRWWGAEGWDAGNHRKPHISCPKRVQVLWSQQQHLMVLPPPATRLLEVLSLSAVLFKHFWKPLGCVSCVLSHSICCFFLLLASPPLLRSVLSHQKLVLVCSAKRWEVGERLPPPCAALPFVGGPPMTYRVFSENNSLRLGPRPFFLQT